MMKSTLEIIYNTSLQCSKCVVKTDEKYREARKGCTGKIAFKRQLTDDMFYTKCAGNFYHQGFAQLLDAHRMFRKGVLANDGGLMDQPSKYLEMMNLIESFVVEKEIEQLKKSTKDGRK